MTCNHIHTFVSVADFLLYNDVSNTMLVTSTASVHLLIGQRKYLVRLGPFRTEVTGRQRLWIASLLVYHVTG